MWPEWEKVSDPLPYQLHKMAKFNRKKKRSCGSMCDNERVFLCVAQRRAQALSQHHVERATTLGILQPSVVNRVD
jgi:hypothetical protein